MSTSWVQKEWLDLCQRVESSAEAHLSETNDQASSIKQAAAEFCQQESPTDYPLLLERVRQAAQLAVSWQTSAGPKPAKKAQSSPFDPAHGVVDAVDEAGMESFPASDPPAYSR